MHVKKKIVLVTVSSSVFIALFTGVLLIQNLESVRLALAHYIHARMLRAAGCDFQTEVTACHLIPLSITCVNTRVVPATTTQIEKPAWHWECEKLTFHFSWLGLLFLNKLVTTTEATGITLYSEINNGVLAIGEHLKKFCWEIFYDCPCSLRR